MRGRENLVSFSLSSATSGLDVGAIPNEITTRIILDSSKSTILAQAINLGAEGVK